MERVRRQVGAEGCLYTGRDITVAVLDSGVCGHPDLGGRIVAFRDFVGNQIKMYDDNGHGTHICGIIGGSGEASGGRYRGIAPGCRLVVGKVLNDRGNGQTEHMLAGLDWIRRVQQEYHVRILNISVGIGELKDQGKEVALCRSLEQLWEDGLTVVCAAGNRGPGEGSLSPLGKSNKVITVGCHDGGYRSFSRPCRMYSGRGVLVAGIPVKPDLVAPGTDIISCHTKYDTGIYYTAKSGTSMATPIVAGAAALLLEQNPGLQNEEIKRRLNYSATDLGEPWNQQGWGMLNIKKIIENY